MSTDFKTLPDGGKDILSAAVRRAIKVSGGAATLECTTFSINFSKELAKIIPTHGVEATMQSLHLHKNDIGLPCDPGFSALFTPKVMPENEDISYLGIRASVDEAVTLSSLVLSYEQYYAREDWFNYITEACYVELDDGIFARVPQWEAKQNFARQFEAIVEFVATVIGLDSPHEVFAFEEASERHRTEIVDLVPT